MQELKKKQRVIQGKIVNNELSLRLIKHQVMLVSNLKQNGMIA